MKTNLETEPAMLTIEVFPGTKESQHLWFASIRQDGRTVYLGPALSTARLALNEAHRWLTAELDRRER